MARIKQGVFSWEDVLAQRYTSNKPPLLSRRRSYSPESERESQSQCLLLSRLSPELRLMIWEMVLGDRRIHVIQRKNQRMGHMMCPLTGSKGVQFCEICNGGGISQPAKQADLTHANKEHSLLGLALSCRQIYSESIHLLYTLNTFEFSNPWSLPYLRPTIPTDLWNSIRTIELRWSFPGHWLPSKDPVRAIYVSAGRAQWLETCRALASLPALRSFAFILGNTWYSEPIEKLPIFLDPLRNLRLQRPCAKREYSAEAEEEPALSSSCESTSSGSGYGSGFSSDEDSGSSSSSPTSPSSEISAPRVPTAGRSRPPLLRSCWYSCSGLPSDTLLNPSPKPPVSKPGLAGAQWELRLQGQGYYEHELGWMTNDLRRRGIDCSISLS